MNRRLPILILLLFTGAIAQAAELLFAGGKEVFIVDSEKAEAGDLTPLWQWSAETAAEIPEAEKRLFHHLDECKPLDGGTRILICASNGGCALIERATRRVLWRARARNAHSLTLLPGDRIAVASSLGGDHLEVFDRNGGPEPVFKTPLPSAHGLVWDDERHCLWALGFAELRAYTLEDWDLPQPRLALKATHALPDEDGHDLRPVPGTNRLWVSTHGGVHEFDRETSTFRPHPLLGQEERVKSVDLHAASGRIITSQWDATARLLSPVGSITFPTARPYKARWVQ